ncbi:unnamed protein product [Effrenium voratum]|uniref:HECT-type E3 ubiquitin transferase n=1 Tax=Effrenium voratum TaxID=2562239 RepID=A0AA36NG53_9DINO|nr:unnamed protein product [Effrenium voratum]CAJ1419009.1 unnamed protein product [Effrenium voratum]
MPWLPERHLIPRLVGLSTTLWLCCKVGSWVRGLGRLGSLLLRLLRPGRLWRCPDYGHLLMVPLYPGNPPSTEAAQGAQRLAEEALQLGGPEALQRLGEAVLLNPTDAQLYLARAKLSSKVQALDDAEMCVSIDAKSAEGWLEKGKAELALSRSIDAAQSFTAGLQLAPEDPQLQRYAALRAEPTPNILQQFKDLFFTARLGLENLFRTLEDPTKTNDAFVESNAAVLDTQLGLLAQTLHVNTCVLFDSSRLCDAYEQIVRACAQLVSNAPASFSRRLQHAENIVEGLSLALRIGWHIHHGIAKHAATALIVLATSPGAAEPLRRLAVRQLLGGLLRWLLDARPEPDREEGEEICGCNCPVPWKAAACFLERLFEPGRPQALVQQECENWPDTVQLCQWLTLSVRDYHATPLGLVALLQFPKVAQQAMRSLAKVDFFIAPHIFGEDFGEDDLEDESEGPEDLDPDLPWWRAAQMSRQPRAWRHVRFLEAAAQANDATGGSASSAGPVPVPAAPFGAQVPGLDVEGRDASMLRWIPDPPPPPPQRLGEWLMNSLGYLFLFIEGDALFTVYACRALQALAKADPEGDGESRLLRGLWLGVPLLSKLSLAACTNTAALDLLHCLLGAKCPSARAGLRSAVRSLAMALATEDGAREDAAGTADMAAANFSPGAPEALLPPDAPMREDLGDMPNNLLLTHDDDLVPSWAEFHHELFQELACPNSRDGSSTPDLVTLANFETKASLLAEHATVHAVASDSERTVRYTCSAVPAAWNRSMLSIDVDTGEASTPEPWQTASAQRLKVFHDDGCAVGSDEYVQDTRKQNKAVLMSRRSIRSSHKVHNWAQAVASAEEAGAGVVVVFNDLDALEPFRMGLFGEKLPNIPAFMVSGKDGQALCAARDCDILIVRSVLTSSSTTPPWPLAGGRLADIAQAWSLLEAISDHDGELEELLQRMSVPEKRVWMTRRLVRHHRHQAEGEELEPALAFVEADRWLAPEKQLEALRQQFREQTGLGAPDVCGEFEVRFRGEQGVGSAVAREWMDLIAREAFLQPKLRLLRSFDQRQTFWPDAAAPFCNSCWKMDYEILGCLVGLALWQNCTLDLPLHPHVCALLFGFPEGKISTSLADMDPDLQKNKVDWLLANSLEQLGIDLSFSDPLGVEEESEGGEPLPALVRADDRLAGAETESCVLRRVGAAEVALADEDTVTDQNKELFVSRLVEWRLQQSVSLQVEAMAKGLSKVLPASLRQEMHSLLTPLEIAQLLSGLGSLSVDDWESHSVCTHGLSKESPVVQWFWQVVRGWAKEEEAMLPQLLQFVTGSARVPVGGFSELVGFNGAKHAFTLAGASHLSPQALPVAHTCICTLDMPPYTDFETMRHKMTQMLRLGRAHFDEGAGQAGQE